jgi:uncharacterized membrane protein (Fun14 family)
MSGIESSIMPFVSTIGFGGIAGFLVGFALKRIMKIIAVIAGVFFAALMYLESQHIVNVSFRQYQIAFYRQLPQQQMQRQQVGEERGQFKPFLGNNSTAAAAAIHIFPITSTMANLGIPLTGSTAMGFTLGILKG